MRVRKICSTVLFIIMILAVSVILHTLFIKHCDDINKEISFDVLSMEPSQLTVQYYNHEEKNYSQESANSCGAAVIRYLLSLYGTDYSEKEIQYYFECTHEEHEEGHECTHEAHEEGHECTSEGVSMLSICNGLERLGFRGQGIKTEYEGLSGFRMPVIALVNNNHYVVITYWSREQVYVYDPLPQMGLISYHKGEFLKIWDGIILQVQPGPLKME